MDKFTRVIKPIGEAVAILSVSLVIVFYAFVLLHWLQYAWNVLSAWMK